MNSFYVLFFFQLENYKQKQKHSEVAWSRLERVNFDVNYQLQDPKMTS